MKIWFDASGGSAHEVWINVYTDPRKDGSGKQYDIYGHPHRFWWTGGGLCLDESELPKELVYSFRHGTDTLILKTDEEISWDREITKEDVLKAEYAKVTPEQVRGMKKAKIIQITSTKDVLDNEKMLSENGLTQEQCKQLHELAGIPFPVMHNGELGLWVMTYQCQAQMLFNVIVKSRVESDDTFRNAIQEALNTNKN